MNQLRYLIKEMISNESPITHTYEMPYKEELNEINASENVASETLLNTESNFEFN